MTDDQQPSGYAVTTPDGGFVGIWRSRTVAEGMTKPRGGMPEGGTVRPMVFADRLAALEAENARLRDALSWYGAGQHYDLPGWEVPDEPGWMCPCEPADEQPWIVEDGGVARTVLAGGHMVDGDDDLIAEPLMTDDEYRASLARCEELVKRDPPAESGEGYELLRLSAKIERYERRMYPGLAGEKVAP